MKNVEWSHHLFVCYVRS